VKTRRFCFENPRSFCFVKFKKLLPNAILEKVFSRSFGRSREQASHHDGGGSEADGLHDVADRLDAAVRYHRYAESTRVLRNLSTKIGHDLPKQRTCNQEVVGKLHW
jgi:hypothetical protein